MEVLNKVVVITGASSGIGRSLAMEMARRGAHLALSDVRGPELEETAAAVSDFGVRVTTEVVDVADRGAVEAHRDRVLEDHGRADVIINNAGVALSSSVANMSYEDLKWIMDIDFWGVVHGTKAFLPHLLDRGDGAIVNISSIFGIVGVPTQSAYNAAKFAVRGFTESLRQELSDTRILVTCVHPGGIKTNITRYGRMHELVNGKRNDGRLEEMFDKAAQTTAPQAARVIADALARDRVRVLIGQDAKALDVAARLFPDTYDAIMRLARRFV